MAKDNPSPWDVRSTEPKGDYRVFKVDALHAERHTDKLPYTFFRIGSPDWVNVVALTDDDRFVMVRQWRVGAASETLEIPGGLVDPGEAAAEAAARELLEETGYRPTAMRCIGQVSPNPALFSNVLYTYLATGCQAVADVRNDSAEETIVELVPREEIDQRVSAGEVNHALVLAGLYWLAQAER